MPFENRSYPAVMVLTALGYLIWLWQKAVTRPKNRGRLGWVLTASMNTLMIITITLWVFVYPSGAMRDEIGLPEALYFAAMLCAMLAYLALRHSGAHLGKYDVQSVLDITVMAASGAAMSWYYLIRPYSHQFLLGQAPQLSIVDFSPYGNIILFTLAAAVLLQKNARHPTHLYAVAMLLIMAADVQLSLIVKGVIPLNTTSTGIWIFSIALFALDAGRIPETDEAIEAEDFTHDPVPALRVLPYIVAACSLFLLIVGTNFSDADSTTRQQILMFGASILLLLMLRQVVTLSENQRLTKHLVAANKELYHQATHDSLTNLFNRRAFLERFGRSLERAAKHNHTVSLVFIDLNRFKAVNDTYGHAAGDQLLAIVAENIRSIIPENGFATRFGGDEFMIALPKHCEEKTKEVINYLHSKLDANVMPEYGQLPISVAAGTSYFPADGTDPEELVNIADLRMYEHKRWQRKQAQ